MDYYQKYLKYKAKYLELKRRLDGGNNFLCVSFCNVNNCKCKQFTAENWKSKCTNKKCGHVYYEHNQIITGNCAPSKDD